MTHSSFFRPIAFIGRALSRLLSFLFGSLKFAWTPPPWLHFAGRTIARHSRAAVLLVIISATVAYGAWRGNQQGEARRPHIILVAAAAGTTPAPASTSPAPATTPPAPATTPPPAPAAKPAAQPAAPRPTVPADVRDTSKPRVRNVTAHVSWPQVGWDEQRQKTTGAALAIHFSAPAAPLGLVGKPAAANTVKLSPEVPGVWKWVSSQQISFEPLGGWMPPRSYDFQFGDGVFAADCTVTWERQSWQNWHAPQLTASFGEQSFYVDPATPALQQTVATVTFSQPVSREEVLRCLSVVNMSETPLFVPGGKPQVIVDEKSPLNFFLRSPLIKPGEKEDLIRFQIAPGLRAIAGGNPTGEEFVTKVTSPSRYSAFFFKEAHAQLESKDNDEPRQFVFLESSVAANGAVVAKAAQATPAI